MSKRSIAVDNYFTALSSVRTMVNTILSKIYVLIFYALYLGLKIENDNRVVVKSKLELLIVCCGVLHPRAVVVKQLKIIEK